MKILILEKSNRILVPHLLGIKRNIYMQYEDYSEIIDTP